MPNTYDKATICSNGHIIDNNRAYASKYCTKCNGYAISKCPNCNAFIPGRKTTKTLLERAAVYSVPLFCPECNSPYPWTEQLTAPKLAAIIDKKIPLFISRTKLLEYFHDIIYETNQTPKALKYFTKYISKVPKYIAHELIKFLAATACKFVCENLPAISEYLSK